MQFLRENSGNYHKIALLRCYKNFYLDSTIVESVDVVCLETIYVAAVAAVKESCNEDFGGALCKEFIIGREPVSIVHYTRPGSNIKQPTPN